MRQPGRAARRWEQVLVRSGVDPQTGVEGKEQPVVAGTKAANGMSIQRAAQFLFTLSALGEIAIGIVALLFPQIVALLLATSLDGTGQLIARMLGSAVLALGVTWWLARRDPFPQLMSRYAAGFLVYNVGIALLFLVRALVVAAPALPLVVAIVHVLAGLGFLAAVVTARGFKAAA